MMSAIEYRVDDASLSAREFLALAQRVWPGQYDEPLTTAALSRTLNVTAWFEQRLVGSVRILTDGYFFGTIPELLVDPDFQQHGIGRHLMELASEACPTTLYFGAQPGKESFYEDLGFERGLQSFTRKKARPR